MANTARGEGLAANAEAFTSRKNNAVTGLISSLTNAQSTYESVVNDPETIEAQRDEAWVTRLRTVANAVANFIREIAAAIAAKVNADMGTEANYANAVSSASEVGCVETHLAVCSPAGPIEGEAAVRFSRSIRDGVWLVLTGRAVAAYAGFGPERQGSTARNRDHWSACGQWSPVV